MNELTDIDQKIMNLLNELDQNENFDADEIFIICLTALMEFAFFRMQDPIRIWVTLNSGIMHNLYKQLSPADLKRYKLTRLN